MAQKARKDLARSNKAALKNLHLGAVICNGLFLAAVFILGRSRSLWLYALISLPAWGCELALERAGRPRHDKATGVLLSPGEDLGAAGLTEYMFDVIWVTWGCLMTVALFGDKAWFLWLVIPAFGAYKGYGLLSAARGMMGRGAGGAPGQQEAPAGNRKQRRAAAGGS